MHKKTDTNKPLKSSDLLSNGVFQFSGLPFDEKRRKKSKRHKSKAAIQEQKLEDLLDFPVNMATQIAQKSDAATEQESENSAQTLIQAPEVYARKGAYGNDDYPRHQISSKRVNTFKAKTIIAIGGKDLVAAHLKDH